MGIYSDRPVVRLGLLELLGAEDRDCASICDSPPAALAALDRPVGLLVLDSGSHAAVELLSAAAVRQTPTVLVLDDTAVRGRMELIRGARAVIAVDDADDSTLAFTLEAARRGLTLLPDGLSVTPAPLAAGGIGEDRLRQVLALLADGLRDAEIAVRMSLSESAARKLVQRAVLRIGARTRCQAVAKAILDGRLD